MARRVEYGRGQDRSSMAILSFFRSEIQAPERRGKFRRACIATENILDKEAEVCLGDHVLSGSKESYLVISSFRLPRKL